MSKAAKKQSSASSAPAAPVAKQQTAGVPKSRKTDPSSKQSRVITMLQAPTGATIAAMMKVTGWQHHSVRGFLAGVVRKRLKLKLTSKKMDGNRIYQITTASSTKPRSNERKHKAS
jgi:hypothetical protein